MSDSARPTVDLSRRDLTLDLTRVFCVLLVVAIHLMMIGVGVDASGAIEASRPLEAQPWFAYATWFGQIMPLFFVVGGFASLTAWRSSLRKSRTAADYIQSRVLRLARPALPLFVFYAVVITGVTVAGVAPELVATVFTGAGSPIWFLAAYTLCQTFVPLMARLHARAPKSTMLVLLLGAAAVDALRFSTGVELVGYLNFVFVWLFVQQVGFWYADGWFDRSRLHLVALAAVSFATLFPLTAVGPYSVDMLTNLNPPTVPLMMLAVSQACVLRLLKPALTALMHHRTPRAVVFVAGTRLMTIYLWHLPVIIALAGVSLLIPGAAVSPGSPAWWLTRPLFYAATLLVVFALSFAVGRFEAPVEGLATPGLARAVTAAALVFVPSFVVTVYLLSLTSALFGAVMIGAAVLLLNRGKAHTTKRQSAPTAAV